MMLRRRGDRLHRILGWIWVAAMFTTALVSFGIRLAIPGQLSWIHILSAATLVALVVLVRNARRHNVFAHRRTARAIVVGALLIAGFFTFPFHRMLGQWLFG